MKKTKALIYSMRLRTLPLSLAGVVLGILLACVEHKVSLPVIVLTLLTTVLLQILTNLWIMSDRKTLPSKILLIGRKKTLYKEFWRHK